MEATQSERPPTPAPETGLAAFFKFAERGTTLAIEAKAGLTTFMVMAYIIVVNPAILSAPPGSRSDRPRPRPRSSPVS